MCPTVFAEKNKHLSPLQCSPAGNYSLRKQGLFFSWSYFQRCFQLLLSSSLTSTGNSSSTLLGVGVEMKGIQYELLATRLRGQRRGKFPPSPGPCAYNLLTWLRSNFPPFMSGAQCGEGKGFLTLSFSSSGHNYSVITQQITTLPFLLGRGVRLDAPTFY